MIEEFVSARIQKILAERKWTPYKLYKVCDCSRNSVYNAVSGESDIRISTLESICKALDMSIFEFFDMNLDVEALTTGQEKKVLSLFREMNVDGRNRAIGYLEALVEKEK
ncbi:Cro/C1-type HTH DNA-binding domain-containing protein [Lachnospiraceae bacterium XBB1006]|nr:Cro/C1-type HTH DNA-binding domain-containing protein [Lachnospiraceae bacterium XBB1006]